MGFERHHLGIILGIRWAQSVANAEIANMTGNNNNVVDVVWKG